MWNSRSITHKIISHIRRPVWFTVWVTTAFCLLWNNQIKGSIKFSDLEITSKENSSSHKPFLQPPKVWFRAKYLHYYTYIFNLLHNLLVKLYLVLCRSCMWVCTYVYYHSVLTFLFLLLMNMAVFQPQEVIKHIPSAALSNKRASALLCLCLWNKVWSVSDVQDKMRC